MRRWLTPIASLMLLGPLAFGQHKSARDTKLFSSDLVLWSYMQEPQPSEQGQTRKIPTPDPGPETPPQQNPTAAQPQQNSPASAASETARAQAFIGTISKDADNFILQVSKSVSYKLDNQTQIQQYEGQRVRVTGTLDSAINLIHVEKVEPMS
jgi:hypothetical protein